MIALRNYLRLKNLLDKLSMTITPSYWEKQQSNWQERYATMKNDEENPNSFFFIDYEDLLENGDDQYHVLFGVKEDVEFATYIASFDDEDDALEYIDWKNMNLPEVYEEDENPIDDEVEEISTNDYKWNN